MNNKEIIIEQLKSGPTTIKFTKVDGTVREMNCTLSEEYLPATQGENLKQSRKENPDVQTVWDIDKGAWRSFRWDSLL